MRRHDPHAALRQDPDYIGVNRELETYKGLSVFIRSLLFLVHLSVFPVYYRPDLQSPHILHLTKAYKSNKLLLV